MTWQYVAGFFDGEGSIGSSAYRNVYPRITFCQSSMPVLLAISEFLLSEGIPSSISGRVNKSAPSHYKDNHILLVKGGMEKIVIVMEKMLPYLIVKKCHVQDMIRFKKMYPRRKKAFIKPDEITINPVTEYSWKGFATEESSI